MKLRRRMPICEAVVWQKHGDHHAVRNEPAHPLHEKMGTDPETTGILYTIALQDFVILPGYTILTLPDGGHYFHQNPEDVARAYEVIEA